MDEIQTGEFWNQNAPTWTSLARSGFDIYRDHFNTPAFFKILPEVKSLYGVDIGCGEGYNTRLLVKHGARMKAIDIAEHFIQKANEEEDEHPLGIEYAVANASQLPFADNEFDFATSFMCLMDLPDPSPAIKEAFRILKPGGFFQFSITHPCFTTPHRKNLRNLITHKTYALEVGGYFNNANGRIDEWIFTATPDGLRNKFRKFKTPFFNRTLTQWFDSILAAGFIIEKINEPFADNETISKYPALQDTQLVAYFLHIRCRKIIS
jgi:ubiquinone/menaquinone biosynthesis C-methylase UbiE